MSQTIIFATKNVKKHGCSIYSGGVILSANGMPFSTYDRDNDGDSERNCAEESKRGWWFNGCYDGEINLNAEFTTVSFDNVTIGGSALKIRRM